MTCEAHGAMPLDSHARRTSSPQTKTHAEEARDADAEARELAARLARRFDVAHSFVRIVADAALREIVGAGAKRVARARKVARAASLAAARAMANAAARQTEGAEEAEESR